MAGAISADGRNWQPAEQLERGTRYRISAAAKDADGRAGSADSTFTTVSPANSFIGNFTPEDGSTVGVGMPVSINFDKAITDKAAVQKGITVTSSSGQEVVGHWFGANRLDFRPEDYWKAGSTVTLKLDLDGVEGANGVYGVQQKTVTFKIGRNQVSIVDANDPDHEGHAGRQDDQDHPDLGRQPGVHHVQRADGDLREVQGDPDGRPTVGLARRASTTSRTSRTRCG